MKQIKKIAFAIGLGLALTAPAVTLSPPVAAEAAETMGYLDEDYELRTSGDFGYIVLADNSAVIMQYTGSASALSIPSTLNGHTVSAIGKNSHYRGTGAFEDNTSIQTVTIPFSSVFCYNYNMALV